MTQREGPDFGEANLSGATIYEPNLSRMTLSGADLRWTRLLMAVLSDSDLSGAKLTRRSPCAKCWLSWQLQAYSDRL